MTRTLLIALPLVLFACTGSSKDEPSDSGVVDGDACELADEHNACDACFDGEVTCSYGAESATENSCGGCQALSALYRDLCDSGITDERGDIEAGVVCE